MPRFSGPIRRAQIVGASGPGAIIVGTDGTSVIAGGLDYWFKRGHDDRHTDISEFMIDEWRLQRELQVDHFRLPPDYREPRRGEKIPNTGLTIPYLRFPRWHVCRYCHRMTEIASTERGIQRCHHCEQRGMRGSRKRGPILAQVPFVAMCEYGHLQEFPWREWVHRSVNPSCRGSLELQATGAATMAAIRVRCIGCGADRTLGNITMSYANEDSDGQGERTYLSNQLQDGEAYLCQGQQPWHNEVNSDVCGRQLRGALLSASNVYFGLTRSAIYLPRQSEAVPSELVEFLETPSPSTLLKMARDSDVSPLTMLRLQFTRALLDFTDAQIEQAIELLNTPEGSASSGGTPLEGDSGETRFRREEYRVLRNEHDERQLRIRPADLTTYNEWFSKYFSRVMLVDKLRETRVQYGFNRVFAESSYDVDDRISLLWREQPQRWHERWLPGHVVYGEGIYFELVESRLRAWESQPAIAARIGQMVSRYERVQAERRLKNREIGPRYVLLHTLAHLLINRLSFECGYSAASLRERLYVSQHPAEPMAGFLLYTAAGDAEGTLGGLVRMGKPGYLEPLVRRSLEVACWCSSDPVCMELGNSAGQGPDSCNLAACHSCALVPETSCEEFNRFLDRGTLVGTFDDPESGFFHEFVRADRIMAAD